MSVCGLPWEQVQAPGDMSEGSLPHEGAEGRGVGKRFSSCGVCVASPSATRFAPVAIDSPADDSPVVSPHGLGPPGPSLYLMLNSSAEQARWLSALTVRGTAGEGAGAGS